MAKINPIESYLRPELSDEKQTSELAHEYLTKLNLHRISLGLDPLLPLDELSLSAQIYSEDLAFDRESFGAQSNEHRCSELGDGCQIILATGPRAAVPVLEAWLESQGHQKFLESSAYTHTGIGVAQNQEEKYIWIQIFVTKDKELN